MLSINYLNEKQLIAIANTYSVEEKWSIAINENDHKWDGWDLISENVIFQLSFEGTIRIWELNGWSIYQVELTIEQEDLIRRELYNQCFN